jgi:nitrate reductase gamma subunit
MLVFSFLGVAILLCSTCFYLNRRVLGGLQLTTNDSARDVLILLFVYTTAGSCFVLKDAPSG